MPITNIRYPLSSTLSPSSPSIYISIQTSIMYVIVHTQGVREVVGDSHSEAKYNDSSWYMRYRSPRLESNPRLRHDVKDLRHRRCSNSMLDWSNDDGNDGDYQDFFGSLGTFDES